MTPVDALRTLLESLRAAGGTLRRSGDALMVRFGRLDAAEREAVSALLRRHKPAVLALLDAEGVFPEVRVVLCAACGGSAWRPAGDGEVCPTCHPAPGRVGTRADEPRPGTAELVALAEAQGWPRIQLARAVAVVGTEAGWRTFLSTATTADLAAARQALKAPAVEPVRRRRVA